MATFVIEGTVSELKVQKDKCSFKISGTEGFAVKQKVKDKDVKFNLLCGSNGTVGNELEARDSVLVPASQDFNLDVTGSFLSILNASVISCKKNRFEFEQSEQSEQSVTEIADKCYSLSSITLFAE